MSEIYMLVIGAVVGAIFGVVFTVWFQEPFARSWRIFRRKLKQLSRRLLNHKVVIPPQPHEFKMGRLKSDAIIIEGTGEESFKRENIRCHYSPEEISLPADLAAIKDHIQHEQDKAKEAGQDYYWNGPWYALEKYVRGRTEYEEDFVLDIWLRPTDYYTFLATSMSLDEYVLDEHGNLVTIRDKYLKNTSWDTVIPFLATSFGVCVLVVTSDGMVHFRAELR